MIESVAAGSSAGYNLNQPRLCPAEIWRQPSTTTQEAKENCEMSELRELLVEQLQDLLKFYCRESSEIR